MALLEEYYELNEAEEVSALWKVLQIGFYVSAACLGLWCGYTLALLRIKFDDKCYLFTAVKMSSLKSENINNANVNWESDSWCDYCQYSMVSSFIVATIWATLFLMCGKGGKSLTGLPQPWRIVWPSLIFNFTYFIVSLCTAINIQKGTDSFCLNGDFEVEPQFKSFLNSCLPLKILAVKDLYITSLQLEIVTKTSWGCVASWLILFLISFTRIIFVIDFNLYRICVFKIGEAMQNKKEEVLRITNYEEPKKIHFNNESRKWSHVEFEEKFEEKARKGKTSKRSMPIQPNAAFYVTTDIRLLNREKQRKKSFRLLDASFEKNKTGLGMRQVGGQKRGRGPQSDVSRMPSAFNQREGFSQEETLQSLLQDSLRPGVSAALSSDCTTTRNETSSNDSDRLLKFKKYN